jgi:hypothetical protein
MAKRKHLYRHGVRLNRPPHHIPQKQYNTADPRPGGRARALKKLSQAKDEAEVKFYLKLDEELQRIAEKRLAEAKKKKPAPKKKATPKRKGVSLKRK